MIEFNVNDMTCGHCVSMITKSVQAADSAARLEIDLGTHCVRVDTRLTSDEVAAAIRDAGYTPQPAAVRG